MPSISYSQNITTTAGGPATNVNETSSFPADGWITEIGVRAAAYSGLGTIGYRNCIYRGSDRIWLGPAKVINETISERIDSISAGVQVSQGDLIRWGFGHSNNMQGGLNTSQNITRKFVGVHPPPDPASFQTSPNTNPWAGHLTYVTNATPSVGTKTAPVSGATGVSLTPTFSGTMPHPAADSDYDSTSAVHLQVVNVGTQVVVYDATFAPTSSEISSGTWSKAPVTLAGSTLYQWRFRHADQFGVYSDWTSYSNFTTLSGPSAPTPVAPTGKINAISGYNYTYIYDHPTPLNANAVQILVKNATGSVTLYDSGTVTISPTIADGTQRDTLEFHADLTWNTTYTHQARFRDTGNVWGPYSELTTFRTDAPPAAPTNLQPSGNISTSATLLTCNVSDPDGDTVASAEIELVNATTGAIVAGFPKAMTVDSNAGTASYQASGDLVLGTAYKWRARANDGLGPGYGAYSSYAFFTYAQGPTVVLLSPPSSRLNLVKQPSAEYDPAILSTYWTETARTGSDYVDRVTDLDPGYGDASWEGTASAAGDNRFTTAYETVDGTKSYLFQVLLKKYSGTAATHFAIECYNSSNTLLGTLNPSTIAVANGTNVLASWTRYGGIVWGSGTAVTPRFPVGTVKVKVVTTHSRNSAAVVRSDGYFAEQVPTATLSTDWPTLQPWYGYGDPDTDRYGEGGYSWTGDAGDSASQVLPVLTAPAQNVLISYTSGLTKNSDRLYIQRWTGSAWASHYDSGWVSSTRTLIPVPADTFRSEERYRLRVECRDSNLTIGSSAWSEVDVRFDGPAEPAITLQQADPLSAQVRIAYELTDAPTEVQFAGVEFAREAIDGSEPLEIIDLATSLSNAQLVDHFPRSGVPYRYKLRQVRNVGASRVQGRWAVAELTCDYSPFSFIKDAEEPQNFAAFETSIENLGTPETDVPMTSTLSWGDLTRSHTFGIAELRSGELNLEFYEDAKVFGHPDAETRYRAAYGIVFGRKSGQVLRRPVCLLLQRPDQERVFAVVVGPARRQQRFVTVKAINFNYEETSYSENFYEREGWT